eukprot:2939532-Amphidinium_carterae.1
MRRLAEQFPFQWGLIARADEKMRSDWWERTRRDLEDRHARGGGSGEDFITERPWESVIRASVRDKDFWDENVRFPAVTMPQAARQPIGQVVGATPKRMPKVMPKQKGSSKEQRGDG